MPPRIPTPRRHDDEGHLVLLAVVSASLLMVMGAGETILETTATPFVALFFLLLLVFRYASN